jgi:transcriptional regulator with XRE-family HTH domain
LPDVEGTPAGTVGQNLRAARERQGINLRELSRRIDVSPSLISQIETGKVRPSVRTLLAMATELRASVDELLAWDANGAPAQPETGAAAPPRPTGPVQRAGHRRTAALEGGVTLERLTPGAEPGVDFMLVTYDVGASSSSTDMTRHRGREYGIVLEGRLGIRIQDDTYELGPGDSIAFDSHVPHRFWNASDEPVRSVWVDTWQAGTTRRAAR